MNDKRESRQGAEGEEPADRSAVRPGAAHGLASGTTRASQVAVDGENTPAPKMPHERDESSSSQAPSNAANNAIGKVAHHDAQTGVDTDRGPVMDAVYNGPVTQGHRTGDEESTAGPRDPKKSTSSRDP